MTNTQLTRVQVYLDPEDVLLLDQLATQIQVTRSQIIRDATKAVATRYERVSQLLDTKTAQANALRDLVGIGVSKTGRVGINVDEIYA